MKKQLLLVLIGSVLACTGVFASGSQEKKPMADDTMMKSDDSMKKTDDTMMKSDNSMKSDDNMMKSDAMMKDGVFKKDGKVMVTMGGKTSDLMKDVMLKDGTKIMMDGTVIMKDGTKGMLMDGDMYDMDGMKSMVDTGMKK